MTRRDGTVMWCALVAGALALTAAACDDDNITPPGGDAQLTDAQTGDGSVQLDGATDGPPADVPTGGDGPAADMPTGGDAALTDAVQKVDKPQIPDMNPGKICGPIPGGACPKGFVCNIKSCAKGATGICVKQPTACPKLWKPVCGCDNKTYPNDCERLKAGMALKHTGQCKVVSPDAGVANCSSLKPCPLKTQVCDITGCKPGTPGTCVTRPTNCPFLWAPVCGCDKKTYANNCLRLVAGAALDHVGQCKGATVDGGIVKPDVGPGKKCGPFPGGSCPKTHVCNIKSCLLGATGVCVVKPLSCPKLWKPVCGCDKKTYANDCERLKAGVALAYTGSC